LEEHRLSIKPSGWVVKQKYGCLLAGWPIKN